MTLYYLKLALISIRGNLANSIVMVVAIGLGVGVCMSMVTVNYLMGKNPIPHKSDQLFYVQLDNWDPNRPYNDPDEPPDQVTWQDAEGLMEGKRIFRQTKSASFMLVIRPEDPEIKPFRTIARATHADFFPMFEVPFLFGNAWPGDMDAVRFAADPVVVLSRKINDQLFGGENSVGRDLRLGEHVFRIVGVLDEWKPIPKFYDLTNNPFGDPEDVFFPFELSFGILSTLDRAGNTSCWKPTGGGLRGLLGSECIWIQCWVELRNPLEVAEYRQFLDDYVTAQKATGRFPRPLNNRLSNVEEWLDKRRVVQPEARMMLAIAVMFLAVCLLNTIGLLLSKFLGKAAEVGVRRALGASRRTLFYQYLIETGVIGVTGGILGLGMTWLGLSSMRALFGREASNLLQLDLTLVLLAILLAIASSIVAGLYPTWRACNISPAAQLKSQ